MHIRNKVNNKVFFKDVKLKDNGVKYNNFDKMSLSDSDSLEGIDPKHSERQ